MIEPIPSKTPPIDILRRIPRDARVSWTASDNRSGGAFGADVIYDALDDTCYDRYVEILRVLDHINDMVEKLEWMRQFGGRN